MAEPRVFRMPSLGADMTEGRLLEWLVQPGDAVHRGDLVAVVKTDKADVEVESFDDGVVGELLVPVGDDLLPIGTPLATIVDAGTAVSAAPTAPAPPAPTTPPPPAPPAPTPFAPAPSVVPPPRTEPVAPVARVPQTADARVAASPYARRRAEELGVDLTSVTAAQPGHPISAADVERAVTAPAITPTAPGSGAALDQAAAMRQAIGRLMARSKREIPHYYLQEDIELTAALAWLEHQNEHARLEDRILPAALLYKATALAAAATPELNGFWVDDHFEAGAGVHVGVAISLRGGGLIAPAVHDADQLSLTDLMAALRDLTARARGGRLRGSEMTDATITVTNLGDRGVRSVFGVIYPPQVALVGFGKVAGRVWDVDDGIGIRPAVTATLSADHRATDGHVGARFLTDLARRLHHPEEL